MVSAFPFLDDGTPLDPSTPRGSLLYADAIAILEGDTPLDEQSEAVRLLFAADRCDIFPDGAPSQVKYAIVERPDWVGVIHTGLDRSETFFSLLFDYTEYNTASVGGLLVPAILAGTVNGIVVQLIGPHNPAGRCLGLAGFSYGGAVVNVLHQEVVDSGLLPHGRVASLSLGAPKVTRSPDSAWNNGVLCLRLMGDGDSIPLLVPSNGQAGFTANAGLAFIIARWSIWQHHPNGWTIDLAGNLVPSREQTNPLTAGLVDVALWGSKTKSGYTTAHSIALYRQRLAAWADRSPKGYPARLVDDELAGTRRDKVATPVRGEMMLVRLFGKVGNQGWSTNFYANTVNYQDAIDKGFAVANAANGAMSDKATYYMVTASRTLTVGDSKVQPIYVPGAIPSASNPCLPPNVAAEFLAKTEHANRRAWWLHGLGGSVTIDAGGASWNATGVLKNALLAFRDAMYTPASSPTGLCISGVGVWNRRRDIRTINNKGEVKSFTSFSPVLVDIVLKAPHGLTYTGPTEVQLKGRSPLTQLPRTLVVDSYPDGVTVRVNARLPAGFSYVKGLNLWLKAYEYVMPDEFVMNNINSHKTGAIFAHLRGRRSIQR